MVGGPGGGQPFASPASPIQFAPGVQHFSPPANQFVNPVSPQFSPGGPQAYLGMAPFAPQQGTFTSPNGQQFMTPQFANQFPQNQGMPFRGGVQFGVPANGQQFNPAGGQFRPPPTGQVQFQVQPGQPQQGSPGMNAQFQGGPNGQFQGGGNGQGFAPNGVPMFASQPMGGYAMPGGMMYVSPDQFQAQVRTVAFKLMPLFENLSKKFGVDCVYLSCELQSFLQRAQFWFR